MEGQPAPAEKKVQKEDEVRDAISPSVAHILYGAIRRRFTRPERQTVGQEDKTALHAATPDALKPIANGINALSVESRAKAPQMGEIEWNHKVWNLLNSYVAADVDADLREERLKAFASLDLKLGDDEPDATGLYSQVETWRLKYADYNNSNIEGFVEDIASGCKNDDGSTDMAALAKQLDALSPVLGLFGEDTDVQELIKDYARAHGALTQKDENKTVVVNKAATEMDRVLLTPQEARLQKLWDKLEPEPTEAEKTAPIQGRRVLAADGETYTVTKTDDAGLATEIRSDKNNVISGDQAATKIMQGTPDVIQAGTKVIRAENGQEYTVHGMIYREDGGEAWVDLRDNTGRQLPQPARILRKNLEEENGRWKLPETAQPDSTEVGKISELTPELAQSDPERFKTLFIQQLEQKHPLAKKAWDHVCRNGRGALEKITIDPNNWRSEMTVEGNMTLGTHPNADELREFIHAANYDFDYAEDLFYRFSHEMTHNFHDLISRVSSQRPVRELNYDVVQMREQNKDLGLTALGSSANYKNQGHHMQAREDIIELYNMYLLSPDYLKAHLESLTDPREEASRASKGLATISPERARTLFTTIETSVLETLQQPLPEKTETGTVRLTDTHDVAYEMMSALGTTERDQLRFESTPDIILPFLQTKLEEIATVIEPLQGSIVNDTDPAKRQLKLKGKVSAKGSTADFDVVLQNTDQGLQIVRPADESDIKVTGISSIIGRRVIEERLSEIDAILKEQINKELAGLGETQRVQIGDGVIVCDIKKI